MRGLWIRNIFVLGEIALSVVLVTASTLLVRSLLQSQAINLGTDSRKRVFANFNFGTLIDGLKDLLGFLKSAVAGRVLNIKLPLVGDKLTAAAGVFQDMIDALDQIV